jgi:creatinine amidohydrolase
MIKKQALFLVCAVFLQGLFLSPGVQAGQEPAGRLSVHYENLTAPQFVKAVQKSGGTCVIPLGIMEKHGPHLPLGTDLIACRETARLAAEQEYTIVFPAYFVGQIFEARNQPGTLAYSVRLMYDFLSETCAELARNGINKIILYNGHGGNNSFLTYFCQTQLASPRDYAVYLFVSTQNLEEDPEVKKLMRSKLDMHAGERETSVMLAIDPSLVHLGEAKAESGEDLGRLAHLPHVYTGIWWYARFPNHYAGEGSLATAELGRVLLKKEAAELATMIREVKRDTTVLELQKRFYDASVRPVGPVK